MRRCCVLLALAACGCEANVVLDPACAALNKRAWYYHAGMDERVSLNWAARSSAWVTTRWDTSFMVRCEDLEPVSREVSDGPER